MASTLKDKYPKAFTLWGEEVAWIKDAKLREQTLQVWEFALDHSPLAPKDLEEIPFTLLVKECKISFMKHKRATVHVAATSAREIANHFGEELPIDMDVLISGAILLDVGKLLEYTRDKDGKLGTSETGNLLRHTFSGAGLAMRFDLPMTVIHCIAYHSKEGDMGKRTPESYILHHVDFMTFEPFKDHLW